MQEREEGEGKRMKKEEKAHIKERNQ